MSNDTLVLDEIVVRATSPTPKERAEFLENEAKREREFWAEREKEDRSDRNERNSYRNNYPNEGNENRISNIVSGANTAINSIEKDLLAINHQNSFKEIVDKAHGNLHKASKAMDYKDYLDAFSTGFLKNDWEKLEKKVYDTIEASSGALTASIISKGVTNIFRINSRHPGILIIKGIVIGISSVAADNSDYFNFLINGGYKDINEIIHSTVEKMIQDDINDKLPLWEAQAAFEKALQTPINQSFLPMFLSKPDKSLVIELLKIQLEKNYNNNLNSQNNIAKNEKRSSFSQLNLSSAIKSIISGEIIYPIHINAYRNSYIHTDGRFDFAKYGYIRARDVFISDTIKDNTYNISIDENKHDVIYDKGGNDKLVLNLPNHRALFFRKDGNNLQIINLINNGSVTILDWFTSVIQKKRRGFRYQTNILTPYKIEKIELISGKSFSIQEIEKISLRQAESLDFFYLKPRVPSEYSKDAYTRMNVNYVSHGSENNVYHLSLNNHQKHTISDTGGNDKIVLNTNDNSKLWFSKDDINLKITNIENNSDITIFNWFKEIIVQKRRRFGRKKEYRYQDFTNRIEQISTTSGKSISSDQVDKLVQAMSAFGSPKDGQISLTPQQQTDLSKIIAANWS